MNNTPSIRNYLLSFALVCICGLPSASLQAAEAGRTMLEDMTSPQVQLAVKSGMTTIIIPIGGTEQNGPHMALGKHNTRVKLLAGKIATRVGNALVAPTMAYVPEGSISPPAAHMRFAGTISITPEAFAAVIDGTARSFRQHGFTDVVLIGDHGSYQAQLKTIAAKLTKEFAGGSTGAPNTSATSTRVHFVEDYYRTTQKAYVDALRAKGLSDFQVGTHAGSADTSLMLALDPGLVIPEKYEDAAREGPATGTLGDPRKASAALGDLGVELIVANTARAIKLATQR